MYTEEETRIYNQAKDVKNNTAACVTCRKTVPMTAEYSIGFGMYQCYECGEKEDIFLKKNQTLRTFPTLQHPEIHGQSSEQGMGKRYAPD